MNPRFTYTGQLQYANLTADTRPSGERTYATPYGAASSVTTILSLLPAPGLDAWIERVGVEEAERIRDQAAIIGTCMHNRLEAYVKGVPYEPIDSPHEKEAELLFFKVRTSVLSPLSEVYGVEEALYLHNLYAGRTDVLGVYAGKRSVIDYKTGLRPKNEDVIVKYKLQIAAYAVAHDAMFENQPGYQPMEQGVILVGIRPSEWRGAGIQKIIMPEAELDEYRLKWLDVVESFHRGELGPLGLKYPDGGFGSMKLYELTNASVDNELQKTGAGIAAKTKSPPGMNPTTTEPGAMPGQDPMGDDPMGAGGASGDPGMQGGQMGGGAMGGAGGQLGGGMGDPMGGGMGGPPMGGGMGGPPMGGGPTNSPEAPMQVPGDDEAETKKVDDSLFTAVKGMPFVTDFSHDNSKLGPLEIIQKDNADLAQLRTILRNRINMKTASDQYGLYDDPDMKYYQAMASYVDQVIQAKNQAAKAGRQGIEPKQQDDGQKKGKQNESQDDDLSRERYMRELPYLKEMGRNPSYEEWCDNIIARRARQKEQRRAKEYRRPTRKR